MSRAENNPREEQRSFPVSSQLQNSIILTKQGEALLKSTKNDVEKTEPKAADGSSLINIPKIPTEKIQSLVISFWGQIDSADLTKHESRKILTKMFLEVITTITDIILDSFGNLVLEGRENPPQVSEEVVRKAVCPSLFHSFKAALGSTHQRMTALFNVVSEQVTNAVNSVLCCSRMKGERLVISTKSSYRPPKDKMKTMIKHTMTMLRSFKNQVNCGSCFPTKRHSSPEYQVKETSTSTRRHPQKHEGDLDIITAPTWIHTPSPEQVSKAVKTSVPSVMSTETVKEKRGPIRRRISDTLGQCHPCRGRSESSEEIDIAPSIKTAIAEVGNILLTEGIELSNEEQRNLRNDSLLTASAIVNSIIDEKKRIESEHGGSLSITEQDGFNMTHLTEVSDKIKSFFTLCYAKTSLRNSLSCLCHSPNPNPEVSLDQLMQDVSPVLQEMANEENDSLITREELSDLLTGIISHRMVTDETQPQFTDGIRMKVQSFITLMSVHTHRPDRKNMVQRALAKIHRVVFRIFKPAQAAPRAQLTFMEDQVPLPPQAINQEYVGSSEIPHLLQPSQAPQEHMVPSHIPVEAPVPASNVPTVTSDPLSRQWSKKYCNMMVYEVVSRIFQEKMDFQLLTPMSRDLLSKLSENLSQWDVLVKPSKGSCKKVASAVFRDLCKGQEKVHVQHAAFAQKNFSSDVLDAIHRNLSTHKKRPTLGAFL